jgi:hypothetical protein
MRSLGMVKFLRIGALTVALCVAVQASLDSGKRKINMIERGRWPHTGAIAFMPGELLALGMSQIDTSAPGAVSQPTLQLEPNGARATALVDFDVLKSLNHSTTGSSGKNWLFSKLVSGKQPITVSVQITSGHGRMTVHPTAVSVSGYAVSGGALDFLIQNFVIPEYPEAVISKPFALPPNVAKVELSPKSALVFRR